VQAFPSYPNELVERYHMYGQRVHQLDITNGDPQQVGVGSDLTSSTADPRWPGVAADLATVGVGYVTVIPELYGIVQVNPPDVNNPPPGFAVAKVFPDGNALWRVTAAPRDGLAFVKIDNWWTPARREGRNWRFMRDKAIVHLYVPTAGRYRVDFRAHSAAGPRPLVLEDGDTQVLSTTVGAERSLSTTLELPAGRTDVTIVNPGYTAQAIPSGDPRAWSFEVSDLALTRLP
jgi:hypothetical protein